LHGKIAKVIEERLPQSEATEPELLAHHYTEAKLLPKALPPWQKAGSLALARTALAETIAQLNRVWSWSPRYQARRTTTTGSWICAPYWAVVDGAQRLAGSGGLGQPASRAQAGELAPPQRCISADTLWIIRPRIVQGTGGRVASLGHAGNERRRDPRRL
jgi:hypothetical protein